MTIEEVGKLTRWQIQNVYFVDLDDIADEPSVPYKTVFYDSWERRGETKEQIDRRWQDYITRGRPAANPRNRPAPTGQGAGRGAGK